MYMILVVIHKMVSLFEVFQTPDDDLITFYAG